MRTYVCPDPKHFRKRPVATAQEAARSAAAKILEGQCPCCDERLRTVSRSHYGGEDRYGECPCCLGLWRVHGDSTGLTYEVILQAGCHLEARHVAGGMTI